MAIYGIPSAGTTLSASDQSDIIQGFGRSTGRVATGVGVFGLSGDDLITFGALGQTASGQAAVRISGATTVSGDFVGTLSGSVLLGGFSATYSGSTSIAVNYPSGSQAGTGTTVSVAGLITSNPGFTAIGRSTIDGGAGNDSIYLGTQLAKVTSSFVRGGDGNDTISFFDFFNASAGPQSGAGTINVAIESTQIQLNDGNDLLKFDSGTYDFGISAASAGSVAHAASTIAGNAGNDTIVISSVGASGTIGTATQFGGGQGNDSISLNFGGSATKANIVGGFGEDTIRYSGTQLNQSLIEFDDLDAGPNGSADLGTIGVTDQMVLTTIRGGAGNDTVSFSIANGHDGTGNFFAGNQGNDIFNLVNSGGLINTTIGGGQGNDSIAFFAQVSGADASALQVLGGEGNDSITFSGVNVGEGFTAATVIGGAGADFISADVTTGSASNVIFGYQSFTDSTTAAMDTVSIGAATGGNTLIFDAEVGTSLALASFSIAGATATNGVVRFSGTTIGTSFADRFAAVDGAVSQTGRVAMFADGNGRQYLFIQGGSTANDLVVKVGAFNGDDAAVGNEMSGATLTAEAGNILKLTLASAGA